jgi:uncharacterized membrane protein
MNFRYLAGMGAPWHYYFMACIYILAGILHFVYPVMYRRIIPSWIPYRKAVVYLSGVLEIAFGAALFFPATSELALYGIMILLLLFLPVHTHMLRDQKASMGLPFWVLLLRIPLQGLLVFWAYMYL